MRGSRVAYVLTSMLIASAVGWSVANSVATREPAVARAGADALPWVRLPGGLDNPGKLAVSPGGTLYVISGEQVLERLADGTFSLVAGTGRAGFSGDGGPAPDASFGVPAALAVAPNGDLYVADSGNGRVREVLHNGTIITVAGSGSGSWSRGDEPALHAALGGVDALVMGRGGNLYMASAAGVSELVNGEVRWLVGSVPDGRWGGCGWATSGDFSSVSTLAVDGQGDVYVVQGICKEILEWTPSNQMRFVELAGQGSDTAKIASGPSGLVVVGALGEIDELAPEIKNHFRLVDLNRLLGPGHGIFSVANVAVGADGAIYEDTGWLTLGAAIVEFPPAGFKASVPTPRVLWTEPRR
jgi:hypothetical protein